MARHKIKPISTLVQDEGELRQRPHGVKAMLCGGQNSESLGVREHSRQVVSHGMRGLGPRHTQMS